MCGLRKSLIKTRIIFLSADARRRATGGTIRGQKKSHTLKCGFYLNPGAELLSRAKQYHRRRGLNLCVRDGNRCGPSAMGTGNFSIPAGWHRSMLQSGQVLFARTLSRFCRRACEHYKRLSHLRCIPLLCTHCSTFLETCEPVSSCVFVFSRCASAERIGFVSYSLLFTPRKGRNYGQAGGPISTGQLNPLQDLHSQPINLVVFQEAHRDT